MSDTETPQTPQTIVVEYQLPHAPAKVWRALTESDLLARWLMANDFRAEVGHRFHFRAQPMPHWDGIVRCEVREIDPPNRLSFTWVGGSKEAGTFLDTTVTWQLRATDTGTLLRLEHAGFLPTAKFAIDGMSKGWGGHIRQRLEELLAGLADEVR
jgi:uncharacterized protein YndB with AHSA1/START domain